MPYNSYSKEYNSLKRSREENPAASRIPALSSMKRHHDASLDSSSSSSNEKCLLNDPNVYRPQNQLIGVHRDRVCAYDRSTETLAAGLPNNNKVVDLPSSGVQHYSPSSYVPFTGETTQEQTKHPALRQPPQHQPKAVPVGSPLSTASSPSGVRNSYCKSNDAAGNGITSSRTTGMNSSTGIFHSSSPNTSHDNLSSTNQGTTTIGRTLSNSSPRNPYAKPKPTAGSSQVTLLKPNCARSLLPPTINNPYSKPSSSWAATATAPPEDVSRASNNPSSSHPTTTVVLPKVTTAFISNPSQLSRTAALSDSPDVMVIERIANNPNPSQRLLFDPPHAPFGFSTSEIPYQSQSPTSSSSGATTLRAAPTMSRPSVESESSSDSDVVVLDSPSHTVGPTKSATTSTAPVVTSNITNQMASMRPKSWTAPEPATSAATNPVSNSNPFESTPVNRPELPGEAPLPSELVYDPSSITKPIKDEYRNKLTTNARLEQPLLNGWTLYRHQKRAILKGLVKRRVILALDMGLGKTLIGCVWSKAFKESFEKLKIIVVCPVTIKTEWKRTAELATGLRVEDEKKAPKDSLDMSIVTWAKVPDSVDHAADHFVTIFDEAHNMQSMSSNRTEAALKLVLNDKRCVGVLLLTGTPMKNGKPCNLFPLLKAVQHPLGRHQKAYERHFCQGRMASFGRGQQWIATGQANLKQLHRMIESNLLHMTKDEYLKELPPMKRETRTVPVCARSQKQYNEKVTNLAQLKEAIKTNKDLDNKALLGSTQELRVICSFAKIGATVEVAKKILEDEASIVIFTNFAKAAKSIHTHLEACGWTAALLTGETPAKKRQELVDGFQNEHYAVFVATFGAGGVGITLTKARTIIFLDRPWTPGELLQAEDRIRRIGQEKDTRSIWMTAFEFDSQLDKMLHEKNQASKAVLTKTGMISTGDSSTSINIPMLVASIISKSSFFSSMP